MSLWISEMTIVDRRNVVADIQNVLFDCAKLKYRYLQHISSLVNLGKIG